MMEGLRLAHQDCQGPQLLLAPNRFQDLQIAGHQINSSLQGKTLSLRPEILSISYNGKIRKELVFYES